MAISYNRNTFYCLICRAHRLASMLKCGAHRLAFELKCGAHRLAFELKVSSAFELKRGAHRLAFELKRGARTEKTRFALVRLASEALFLVIFRQPTSF